ncbi:hypothetical protein N0V88_007305 [Collariella sp. IMI 366227]|nr:hypothetical protein N0V88_007305 [Collariella sp. IMI 366227]
MTPGSTKPPKGVIAIEEAVLNPAGLAWINETAPLNQATQTPSPPSSPEHRLNELLLDIHHHRLEEMDAHGVEFMLLSLASPGAQGESDPEKARTLASEANDWLAAEVAQNTNRFGALASVSMHNIEEAVAEVTRAVKELGMYGVMVNDYQAFEGGRKLYDTAEYRPFWKAIEELDVPVYMHPRYPPARDLVPGTVLGDRRHILGAAMQFDLSMHLIPFNLWRADHWYNKLVKRDTRPSKEDYSYYFTTNISITTSGNFNTQALKYCVDYIGPERCLFSIDYPYDTMAEAQWWWFTVDLPEDQKQLVARENAIRLFKLPLEI